MFERIALIKRSLYSAMSVILLVLSFFSSIMSLITLCWERARFRVIVITRGTPEETNPRIFLKRLKKDTFGGRPNSSEEVLCAQSYLDRLAQ
jgi:hypothetical protein